jgi:hypothetical protein
LRVLFAGKFFLEMAQMLTVRFWWLGDGGNRVNVCLRPKENRMLITGLHVVADIYCNCCQQILGWKYEEAFEEKEKYKEGKYIIEKAKMTKENW